MATFLDITGLQNFSSFFVFIFVWLAVFAILTYSRVLGDNKGIQIIIGLIIGLFVLFSPIATGAIEYIAPWFAVVFIFVIFATMAIKSFGATGIESLGSLRIVTLVVIILVMVIGTLSYVRQQILVPGDNETSIDYSKTTTILFHPKIMGVLFIMIIAVFAIVLMAGRQYIG
ncbi:MAG: hypothetical protein KKC75_07990 [Nanoarchaeota archaeon]|nr:hypothetical protein [Nanoarchaeota archaeon]MBU1005270.1 hypothetical protein [Nanoarchaeota archaeon]MBU1947007.1 hypothetical protein [Nanoarchaeota archaeon]